MKFDPGAWTHAKTVIQSEGYPAWLDWMMKNTDKTWLNGLASHITHTVTTDRADLARRE